MNGPTQSRGRRAVADCVWYEAAVAVLFWVPYMLTDGAWQRIDLSPEAAVVLFGLWLTCPFLTLVGLLMLPRAMRLPLGWFQALLSLLMAATIWYQFTRIELP